MKGFRSAAFTQAIHPYVEKLDDPQAFLDANKGTLWSMRVGGVDWTDPLAVVEMAAAAKRFHWPLIASAALPVLLAVLLGKVFCSWLCPAYVLFELTGKLRSLLRFAEIEPGEIRFSYRNKYIFLAVGVALATILSGPLFALIYPPAVVSRALHAWVFGTTLTGMVVLLCVLLAVELFVSPRWWCRFMCPGGALYGLLGWLRPVRIKLRTEACTGCKECIPVCEAGINPITQSGSIECDNCGVCIRHCGDNALYYTIGLPELSRPSRRRSRVSPSKQPGKRDHQTIAALIVGAAVLIHPTQAVAHHILGLPHYSYKENYPQRPTLEYPATTGPYDVLLTSYPGIPVPGEPANLALYIKDREGKVAYGEPISLRVLRTATFGDNELIVPPTIRTPFEHQYKLHVTFPTDGEYIVELSMPVEGRTEVIPFLMIAGQPSAAASMALAGSVGFVILIVMIRAIQKKRQRRHALAHGGNVNAQASVTLHRLAQAQPYRAWGHDS
jgi:ferredoxin-type protein NapH